MTSRARLAWICGGLAAVLIAVALGSLLVGAAPVPPRAVLDLIAGRGPSGGTDRAVVLSIRLPRIAAAVLAGGALAVAGAGFQALTRNPLAEPSILGVSGGAAFGVVVAQVSGLGQGVVDALGLAAFGFAGAVAAALAVYLIASSGAGLPVHTLLLAGVIVGIFFSASITVLISIVDANRLGGVIYWLLGSVAPIPPGQLVIFTLVTAVGVWLVLGQARALNLLALGEDGATELGAALLTGTVVAFVGPIGFVGLIVPQAFRMVLGPDNRVLVPAALLGGGAFLLAADTLARTVVAPAELSVGVLTSFCGAPFFIWLLRSRVARVTP